jgi:hypothetical protein
MESALSKTRRSTKWIVLVAFVALLVNFAIGYPGRSNHDSLHQFQEAITGQFTDWHPPIMAVVWSHLRWLSDGPLPIFAIQLIFHWLGFGLIAATLHCSGRTIAAWIALGAGAYPFFLVQNVAIFTDVVMASVFLSGFAIVFWYRMQGRRPPTAALLAGLILLTFGALVRVNGVFAFGPLLVYSLWSTSRLPVLRLCIISILFAGVSIPISSYINHQVIGAVRTEPVTALQVFDLAGMAVNANDPGVADQIGHMSLDAVRNCYKPIWFDALFRNCDAWSMATDVPHPKLPVPSAAAKKVQVAWIAAIREHPIAYLKHRLKHFNSELYFLVPPDHLRFTKDDGTGADTTTERLPLTQNISRFRRDYLLHNVFSWPVTWLVAAVCAFCLLLRGEETEANYAARILLLSGIFYSLAYLVVGVASQDRYYYWSTMTAIVGLIIALPGLWPLFRRRDGWALASLILVLGTVAAGFAARLSNYVELIF